MSYNPDTGLYTGYIYCIENRFNGKKYIGQTTRTVERRWFDHCNSAINNTSGMVIGKALRKYGIDNFDICCLLTVESVNKDDVQKELNLLEKLMIKIHKTLINENGYNVSIGGKETVRKITCITSYNMLGNELKRFDSCHSASIYYNIPESKIYGICAGDIPNYKKQFVFRKNDEPFDKYPVFSNKLPYDPSVRVDAYDADTLEYIGTYHSMKSCAKELGIPSAMHISSVCRGERRVSYGFIFRYHGDSVDKYDVNKKNWKRPSKCVNQYSLNDEFISVYNSISDAAKAVSLCRNARSVIGNCCNKRVNTAYGYKWFFAYDPSQPDKSKVIPLTA